MRLRAMRMMCVMAVSPSIMFAQSGGGKHAVFSIPDSHPMACVQAPPDIRKNLPARATALEFRIGAPIVSFDVSWPREIAVVFDTIGGPVYMSDNVTHYSGKGSVRGADLAIISFLNAGGPVGVMTSAVVDSTALDLAMAAGNIEEAMAAQKPPVQRPLSVQEIRRGKALGVWLWERRCIRQ